MLSKSAIEGLVKSINKRAASTEKEAYAKPAPPKSADDDLIPIGIDGVLSASEKILAINRGLVPPDERDSPKYKTIHMPHRLLAERVELDADNTKNNLARAMAKHRTLKGWSPFALDRYSEGLIEGNPLSMPLEETNPMQIIEQARRITQMGPGGIQSDDSISPEAQAVHDLQFGFVDPLAGPESGRAGVDSRLASGVRIGTDGRLYKRFRNRKTGKYHWLNPVQVSRTVVKFPD